MSLTALFLILDLCGCKKGGRGNDIKDAELGMVAWTQTMLDTSVDSLVAGDGFLDGNRVGILLNGSGYDTCCTADMGQEPGDRTRRCIL